MNERSASDIIVEDGIEYHRHSNGGGLVALTASVSERSKLGPDVRIKDGVTVKGSVISGKVVISDEVAIVGSVIDGEITISGEGWVEDSHIGGEITFSDYVVVTDSVVTGKVALSGEIAVLGTVIHDVVFTGDTTFHSTRGPRCMCGSHHGL